MYKRQALTAQERSYKIKNKSKYDSEKYAKYRSFSIGHPHIFKGVLSITPEYPECFKPNYGPYYGEDFSEKPFEHFIFLLSLKMIRPALKLSKPNDLNGVFYQLLRFFLSDMT